ncbi:MAG: hypothetical protein IKC53_09185, partial [Lentisphaeria bacterium]|nr:hypothetical protein [Lentisphaeria bacterium]
IKYYIAFSQKIKLESEKNGYFLLKRTLFPVSGLSIASAMPIQSSRGTDLTFFEAGVYLSKQSPILFF